LAGFPDFAGFAAAFGADFASASGLASEGLAVSGFGSSGFGSGLASEGLSAGGVGVLGFDSDVGAAFWSPPSMSSKRSFSGFGFTTGSTAGIRYVP